MAISQLDPRRPPRDDASAQDGGTPDLRDVELTATSTVPAAELESRRRERAQICRRADELVTALAEREYFVVPKAYAAIADTLAAAHAAYLIERWSEQAQIEEGSPWVRVAEQEWINHSGLAPEEWIESRRVLRGLGLISERRYYCEQTDALATEFRFNTDALARHLAELRAEFEADMLEGARRRRLAERQQAQDAQRASSARRSRARAKAAARSRGRDAAPEQPGGPDGSATR